LNNPVKTALATTWYAYTWYRW